MSKIIKAISSSVVLFLLPIVLLAGMIASLSSQLNSSKSSQMSIGSANGLSEATLALKPLVEKYANQYHISSYVNLLLAIIEVESGGNGGDPMQSSESLGYDPNTIQDPEISIEAGAKHLSKTLDSAKSQKTDVWTAVGAYNFGTAYVSFISRNGGVHTLELAEQYSRDVVAPSLGNTTGETYTYDNAVSRKYNKTYLYLNGGNFFYVEKVKEHLLDVNQSAFTTEGTFSSDLAGDYVISSQLWQEGNYPDIDPNHIASANGGFPGQCTWYVYNRFDQLGCPIRQPRMGNGGEWGDNARAKGYPVSHTPRAGTAVSIRQGLGGINTHYGHVAFVEKVNADGSILISEMNFRGEFIISTRTISASVASQLDYIDFGL